MSGKENIAKAERYLALSNAHALEDIFAMFEPGATYRSSQFGAFAGIETIKEMMTSFFTRFPDTHWEVGEYVPTDDHAVEFDFIMRAHEKDSGEAVERHGRERIEFSPGGRIRHIEVSVTQT